MIAAAVDFALLSLFLMLESHWILFGERVDLRGGGALGSGGF
jgi:hypothetical protein